MPFFSPASPETEKYGRIIPFRSAEWYNHRKAAIMPLTLCHFSPASPETEKYGRIIDRKNTDGFSLCGAKALLF
jgi:hypothetical protein